jgi:EAL domain-containing protein (putative c-di-GMP-specific phosphodiesterase class I)/CHASE2 domain-containing sensor protein
MIWPFRKKAKGKKPVTRLRIFIWPFLLCSLMALIGISMPLEDLYRGARDYVRARPADGSVVVIGIDDRTVNRFQTSYYSRKYNAVLIDRAIAGGAKRIYFDESFKLPLDAEGDDLFAEALKRHRGKVHLGAVQFLNWDGSEHLRFYPIEKFRSQAPVRSMHALKTLFGLSALIFYGDEIDGQVVRSISSDIAGVERAAGTFYRPDWSISVKSVPALSLVDVLDNKFPADFFAGKDVIVGVTAQTEPDFLFILGQGWVPGLYAHAIGAQTLKEGNPVNLGGFPALLIASVISIALLRTRSRREANRILGLVVILGVALPFALDALFIDSEYFPAYLMFGTVYLRSNTLRTISEARLLNAATLLPNLSALREEPTTPTRPIIAMRIRNYAAVCASFPDAVESDLMAELCRRLTLPGQNITFYQAEDVLYWLGPASSKDEITSHLAGLAKLIESHLVIQGRKLDIHVAFGVDIALARPVTSRIGRALLAADQAASKHQIVQFNTNENDEETAWELSLMSELDEAIDSNDIWVAFQPQFCLKTDQIIGAEALVRWQHPIRGAVSPEAFVLAAEQHNRIARLTFHVLEKSALSTVPLLASSPNFRLSVNLSASLLESPELPAEIADCLARTGFPTSNLTLEVTESTPFAEHAVVAANLTEIAAMGIDLSIDDYGTGNATLDYLRTVPCQEIKIDRRFVANLGSNAGDMLLVESTIELAHGLGRRVIAEGIEDPETMELLRAIRCDIAQGYYLAKPMQIEALEALLASNHRMNAA